MSSKNKMILHKDTYRISEKILTQVEDQKHSTGDLYQRQEGNLNVKGIQSIC